MTDASSRPSRDPSMDGTLVGMLTTILNKFVSTNLDGALPAVVESYDAEKNQASVRPMVKIIATDGRSLDRAILPSVPVFQIGAGKHGLFFNDIQKGDLGWIVANDRDISLYLQSLTSKSPNTDRTHSFEDAIFFPDVLRGWAKESGERASFQNKAGSVKVALKDLSLELLAPTVNIKTKVNLGSGGPAIARLGDTVTIVAPAQPWDGATGTITSASSNHTAN